jgi:hypothetical protein
MENSPAGEGAVSGLKVSYRSCQVAKSMLHGRTFAFLCIAEFVRKPH